MRTTRFRDGIGIGIIAGAATAGTLLGFGRVRGAALQPLNAVAHIFAGSQAFLTTGFDPGITLGAIAIHFTSAIIWGLVLAYVAATLRGRARLIAPAGVALFAYLVDRFVAPHRLRPGFEELLSSGETILVYVVLALALALGLWAAGPRIPRD